MRYFALLFCLVVGVVTGTALAQKVVTFSSAGTVIEGVDLRRTEDGGFSLTVYGTNASDAGVTLMSQRTCEVSSLTAAQRTALVTIRNAALACWNNAEGL